MSAKPSTISECSWGILESNWGPSITSAVCSIPRAAGKPWEEGNNAAAHPYPLLHFCRAVRRQVLIDLLSMGQDAQHIKTETSQCMFLKYAPPRGKSRLQCGQDSLDTSVLEESFLSGVWAKHYHYMPWAKHRYVHSFHSFPTSMFLLEYCKNTIIHSVLSFLRVPQVFWASKLQKSSFADARACRKRWSCIMQLRESPVCDGCQLLIT